uniref:Uncharacterized protein n=1 Tax=Rhizophora mucronata TaxID=61149 RepID=A0A2P2NPP9_RHIMU
MLHFVESTSQDLYRLLSNVINKMQCINHNSFS